ncbi:hypothetical protein ACH4UM_18890 [Streptomyces sp. NPDC020801]|uniref:hypothetical protein n=1 Tax=Streptomyces sp. NPDC020801 TaxID=3365093 RepID=UPI00379F3716
MSDTRPGADELRIRSILKKRGVGPDAQPPELPPGPPPAGFEPASEWWEHKPPTTEETEPDNDEQPDKPPVFAPQPGYYPRPHTPAFIDRSHHRAEAALSPRTRSLLYNASAAGTGWLLGLYHQLAAAIADCGQHYSVNGALVLGAGGSLLIAHFWDRRTRHWWTGLAWAARIPLATAILALALWAPAA